MRCRTRKSSIFKRPVARISEAIGGRRSPVSRSLSSGAHWRVPLARPGYELVSVAMVRDARSRAPHHEGEDGGPHPEKARKRRLEGWATHTSSFSRHGFVRGIQFRSRPSKARGRGEDRVRAAPAVSCAMMHEECAHEHTGEAEAVRPSPRNGFTTYTCSFAGRDEQSSRDPMNNAIAVTIRISMMRSFRDAGGGHAQKT
jgi:hypothetical protein